MAIYEMIFKSITLKKQRQALTSAFKESTKRKLDIFLMAKRITEDDYNKLLQAMEN